MERCPCYRCSRHGPTCHIGCADYQRYAERFRVAREQAYRENGVESYIFATITRDMRRRHNRAGKTMRRTMTAAG